MEFLLFPIAIFAFWFIKMAQWDNEWEQEAIANRTEGPNRVKADYTNDIDDLYGGLGHKTKARMKARQDA